MIEFFDVKFIKLNQTFNKFYIQIEHILLNIINCFKYKYIINCFKYIKKVYVCYQ